MSALGDATRREIFERLAEGPCPVGELARKLPVTRPAVSQHLRVPSDAGLVIGRQEAPAGCTRSIPTSWLIRPSSNLRVPILRRGGRHG